MKKSTNRRGFTIVELVIVIAVIAILATVLVPTFGGIIQDAKDAAAKQEAKNAYTDYIVQNDGVASEYMIYEVDGRFVALQNGSAVGVYGSKEDALAAMVDNFQHYRAVRVLTENMYHVLDLSDYIGKKIACIGDSVTDGYIGSSGNRDRSQVYVTNLGSSLGTDPINLGISGTTLCKGGHRDCNITKLDETLLDGADIVTIYLGVNDWDQAKDNYYALGAPDSTDTSTIYGAVKMWCNKIEELKNTEQYKNTMFFFITPHLTSWNNSVIGSNQDWDQNKHNIHGYTQKDMSEAIKTVCNEYGIPVIDMYDYTVRLYYQNPTKFVQEYGGDGIHPTAVGHELMTDYILYEFARQQAVD